MPCILSTYGKTFCIILNTILPDIPVPSVSNVVQCFIQSSSVSCWTCPKKALREMQTLRAGCSKAEPKFLAPPQTPFSGVRDGQNLISLRWSLPLLTDPVWWGSMRTQFRVIVVTDGTDPHTQTQTQTHRQDRLKYTVPQLASMQCN